MSIKNLIVVGYARSGLTILNRYLAGDQRLICLSEVNSRYLCPTLPNDLRVQLKEWYDITLDSNNFTGQVSEILENYTNQNRRLVIRDWSFGSFVPLRYNNLSPSNTLNTIDDIKTCSNEFEVVCIMRNPLDVWLSMNSSKKTFHDKELKYLLNFTKDVVRRKIKILKYEDFVADPENILDKLYGLIDMKRPENLTLSNKVIGDSNYPESSRGAHLNTAITLPKRPLSKEDHHFLTTQSHINEISNILGYPAI